MPCADFHKPNPLDSDVILDATARLLAPRKPVTVSASVPVAPKKVPAKKEKTAPKQEPAKAPEQPKTGTKKKKKAKRPQTPVLKAEVPKPQPAKPKQAEKKPAPNTGGKKQETQKKRPRNDVQNHRSDRQKDSTQQKSLMKPYYMNHEE